MSNRQTLTRRILIPCVKIAELSLKTTSVCIFWKTTTHLRIITNAYHSYCVENTLDDLLQQPKKIGFELHTERKGTKGLTRGQNNAEVDKSRKHKIEIFLGLYLLKVMTTTEKLIKSNVLSWISYRPLLQIQRKLFFFHPLFPKKNKFHTIYRSSYEMLFLKSIKLVNFCILQMVENVPDPYSPIQKVMSQLEG